MASSATSKYQIIGTKDAQSLDDAAGDTSLQQKVRIYLNSALLRVRAFVVDQFILVALSIAIIIAFSCPTIGRRASSYISNDIKIIEFINNIFVFFISGITLRVEDMQSIYKHRYAACYGLICINIITTFLGFVTI